MVKVSLKSLSEISALPGLHGAVMTVRTSYIVRNYSLLTFLYYQIRGENTMGRIAESRGPFLCIVNKCTKYRRTKNPKKRRKSLYKSYSV